MFVDSWELPLEGLDRREGCQMFVLLYLVLGYEAAPSFISLVSYTEFAQVSLEMCCEVFVSWLLDGNQVKVEICNIICLDFYLLGILFIGWPTNK